ncbi:MAG TPA: hypothetical protein VEX68_04245 [Bryobacteraceae bacterium]|nr:hypothetical protein [Bryobacteraceae bacterium]
MTEEVREYAKMRDRQDRIGHWKLLGVAAWAAVLLGSLWCCRWLIGWSGFEKWTATLVFLVGYGFVIEGVSDWFTKVWAKLIPRSWMELR